MMKLPPPLSPPILRLHLISLAPGKEKKCSNLLCASRCLRLDGDVRERSQRGEKGEGAGLRLHLGVIPGLPCLSALGLFYEC
uniref:Uncharacterized protein n=1 Tax=Knipowitschia caucasica TaxID=637954 RepID=A0AAV2J1M1_KNICA